jgi:hypothetical protein
MCKVEQLMKETQAGVAAAPGVGGNNALDVGDDGPPPAGIVFVIFIRGFGSAKIDITSSIVLAN